MKNKKKTEKQPLKKHCIVKPRTKIGKVEQHLLLHGTINSIQAIKLYNATRLSAIIHELRYKRKMKIVSKSVYIDGCKFANYTLKKK